MENEVYVKTESNNPSSLVIYCYKDSDTSVIGKIPDRNKVLEDTILREMLLPILDIQDGRIGIENIYYVAEKINRRINNLFSADFCKALVNIVVNNKFTLSDLVNKNPFGWVVKQEIRTLLETLLNKNSVVCIYDYTLGTPILTSDKNVCYAVVCSEDERKGLLDNSWNAMDYWSFKGIIEKLL